MNMQIVNITAPDVAQSSQIVEKMKGMEFGSANVNVEMEPTMKTVTSVHPLLSAKMPIKVCATSEIEYMSEIASDWNLNLKPGAGGIVTFTKQQNLEKDAIDGLLHKHSKKSYARVGLKLTMCKGMLGTKCALAK